VWDRGILHTIFWVSGKFPGAQEMPCSSARRNGPPGDAASLRRSPLQCSAQLHALVMVPFMSFILISLFMVSPLLRVHPERSLWSSGAPGVGSEDCRRAVLLGKLPIWGAYILYTRSVWTLSALISPIRLMWKVQQDPRYPSLLSPQPALVLLLSNPSWGVALWIPFDVIAVFTDLAGCSLPAAYLPSADKPGRSLSIGL